MVADYDIKSFGPGILDLFHSFYTTIECNDKLAVTAVSKIQSFKGYSVTFLISVWNVIFHI